MTIYDYELVDSEVFSRMATKLLLPETIPSTTLERRHVNLNKVLRYRGFQGKRLSKRLAQFARRDG